MKYKEFFIVFGELFVEIISNSNRRTPDRKLDILKS